MEVPQIDGMEPEEQDDERMEVPNQLSQDLQENFEQAETKHVLPFLGKLDQDGSLVCPEPIEEPGEEVDRLILYQTVEEEEEETMEDSLDAETLIGNATGAFLQARGIAADGRAADLADQVDEISEGRVDHVHAKHNEMELGSIYISSSPAAASKSEVKTEVSMEQESYEGVVEDLTLPDSKNRVLTFSLGQENKDNMLKIAPNLAVNSIDAKPNDLKFSLLPDNVSTGGKKAPHLQLPIKVEETKTEAGEDDEDDDYPDSSEVKRAKFIAAYSVKSEVLVTKAEQLDFSVKPETLETKPEDLSLPMKPESLDSKQEVLQFAAYSHGAEIKPEAKPVVLGFATYIGGVGVGVGLKTEAKPEFAAYPDSSEIKPEAKPEGLEFGALPEIKAETKQELLEADSTVLTPKLEQTDGLVDATETLVMKGQVKEERPSTPGKKLRKG